MKRATAIQREYDQIGTIEDLASVFEAIASMHISQIKDKVVTSTAFFNELWNIYSQLRVEEEYAVRRRPRIKDRVALVAVTGEGGLSGDIDERIIKAMLEHTHDKAEIYVVGDHGATLLTQRGVRPAEVFALPNTDRDVHVAPIVRLLAKYERATVFYQTYVSLMQQGVARIDLFSAVNALGKEGGHVEGEIISSRDYIFEPSIREIIAYMESVMLGIALGQVVLESKLAQYASRFNAMNQSKTKAKSLRKELNLKLQRAKRSQGDDRTKEILSAMKMLEASRG